MITQAEHQAISQEFSTHRRLMDLTATMPMKQIDIGGKPYLQRYFVQTLADGRDLWLHRFLSADGEQHLHSHPFNSESVILCGGYVEETGDARVERYGDADLQDVIDGTVTGRVITVFDWHRIVRVEPDTWTAFIVSPERLPFWYFLDDGRLTPVPSSPRDWWKFCGTRDDAGVAL